jgi:Ni,Fe-hydrogenase III small subunit
LLELNACGNINFDLGRYGVGSSPAAHADAVLVTGRCRKHTRARGDVGRDANRNFILAGACALSGGVFAGSPALARGFFDRVKPDLYLPGCPVHPLTVVNALLDFIGA